MFALIYLISEEDVTYYFNLVSEIERLLIMGSNTEFYAAVDEAISLCSDYGMRADGSQHEVFLAAEEVINGT